MAKGSATADKYSANQQSRFVDITWRFTWFETFFVARVHDEDRISGHANAVLAGVASLVFYLKVLHLWAVFTLYEDVLIDKLLDVCNHSCLLLSCDLWYVLSADQMKNIEFTKKYILRLLLTSQKVFCMIPTTASFSFDDSRSPLACELWIAPRIFITSFTFTPFPLLPSCFCFYFVRGVDANKRTVTTHSCSLLWGIIFGYHMRSCLIFFLFYWPHLGVN